MATETQDGPDDLDARLQAARRASGELRARLDSLRTDVQAAEARLDTFKAENGLIASSGRIVNEQQLSDINVRLVAAQARTAAASDRSASAPPREDEPRTTASPKRCTQRATSSPSRERLASTRASRAPRVRRS